jgi:ADP-heptose:LPS heptosyltransferase
VGLVPVTSAAVNRYPAQSWAKTVAGLWLRRRILCAFLGGERDDAQIDEITTRLHQIPHLRMARPLDLPAISALIGSLDGLLSVDTGMAHIALAQDVPATVIVGGSHPGRFFPGRWRGAPPS